jgi:tetratricopeptide (TPR) repeat protein
LLGVCREQEGLADEAVKHFKKAVALKPDFKAAHNNLGGVYLLEGRYEDAIKAFREVIRLDPKDAQARYHLARAEIATGQTQAGIDHLRQAHDLSPGDVAIAMALAQGYKEAGQKEAGLDVARRLAMVPASPQASMELELGKLLLAYGNQDGAAERFHNALRLDPGAQETLFALGRDYFRRQDCKSALTLLEIVGGSMWMSATWHELVGYCHFKLGDPARAAGELHQAVEIDPRNEDYVIELSEVFLTYYHVSAAITLLEEATKVFPDSPRIWFAMGVARLVEERHSLAEAAFKKSLELDPSLDLALVLLGYGYKETGRWGELLETGNQLLQLNPGNHVGYYYKAVGLLKSSPAESSPEDEIEKLLRKSLELDGNDPEPRYELARCLERKGRDEAALREYQEIVQSNPNYGPAYYRLYELYRRRGEMAKSEDAKKAHDRIRQQEGRKVVQQLLVKVRQRSR